MSPFVAGDEAEDKARPSEERPVLPVPEDEAPLDEVEKVQPEPDFGKQGGTFEDGKKIASFADIPHHF